tara:strand:+ start:221 stop:421 length:201 start_codon:yes stop_codon:yes gene_type:complete
MNVEELINELKKYDPKTEVCGGYLSRGGYSMTHTELIIRESHPIGDRDSEDELLLWLGTIVIESND